MSDPENKTSPTPAELEAAYQEVMRGIHKPTALLMVCPQGCGMFIITEGLDIEPCEHVKALLAKM